MLLTCFMVYTLTELSTHLSAQIHHAAFPEFVVGTAGGVECPKDYNLVDDIDVCRKQAATALKISFSGEGCLPFAAVGCFTSPGAPENMFSTCDTKETHQSHAPICRKGTALKSTESPTTTKSTTTHVTTKTSVLLPSTDLIESAVGSWAMTYPNNYKDTLTIKNDATGFIISSWVIELSTFHLSTTDNGVVFPRHLGWMRVVRLYDDVTWAYLRTRNDENLEIHLFRKNEKKNYEGLENYWMEGSGKRLGESDNLDNQQPFRMFKGAFCSPPFEPLTSSWEDCRDAAKSLGFSGDSISEVDYLFPWGTTRPQGCHRSDGNGQFHFNKGKGGAYIGKDQILCRRELSTTTTTDSPIGGIIATTNLPLKSQGDGETGLEGLGLWSHWGECSSPCNRGVRRRSLNKVMTSHGESTLQYQEENCKIKDCPVHGKWLSWSETWSPCTTTCGLGTKFRKRKCKQPMYGGDECRGTDTEVVLCPSPEEIAPCPVNGNWSSWSSWSVSDAPCGVGQQVRTRQCDNPRPDLGGKLCVLQNKSKGMVEYDMKKFETGFKCALVKLSITAVLEAENLEANDCKPGGDQTKIEQAIQKQLAELYKKHPTMKERYKKNPNFFRVELHDCESVPKT